MVLYDNEVLGYRITPQIRVAPSPPVQSAILELSCKLIRQPRDDLVVLQGDE
jgi:hypothetical protein